MVTKICEFCGNEFQARKKTARFCSQKCRNELWYITNKDKAKKYYEANKEEMGNKNRTYYQDNKEKLKAKRKNNYKLNRENILNQNKVYYETNKEKRKLQIKKYKIEIGYPKMLKNFQENGFKFESVQEMQSARWNWGEAVKKTQPKCQRCGSTLKLEAHHIIPVSMDITKALDIDNGITLCAECHRLANDSFHRMFPLESTLEQFKRWLSSYIPEDEEQLILDEFLE